MINEIPTIQQGFVVGRVLGARDDAADVDKLVDVVVEIGEITFTPSTKYRKLDPQNLVTHRIHHAVLDSHGHIHPKRESGDGTGSDSEDGVWLPAGTYTVSYQIEGDAEVPDHDLLVTTEHTVEAPKALFSDLGEAPQPGATYVAMLVPLNGVPGQTLTLAESTLALTWTDPNTAGIAEAVEDYLVANPPAGEHTHGVEDIDATGTRDATTYLRGDGTWSTATFATRLPLSGAKATPSGGITWTANPALTFFPRSIGVDGSLYFTYLNTLLMRSSDPTLAVRTTGPDFATKTPSGIIAATRTTAGYVVITNSTGTDTANVWFCPQVHGFSSNLDHWTMVQSLKAVTDISIARPRIIAGVSWLLVGEYVTGSYPSSARKLWLSRDGGQTWTSIRESIVNDSGVNSHWHTGLIMPSGRIWASQGDGVNSWFGYTDDCGASWVPVPIPASSPLYTGNHQQPTVMLDLRDTIAVTPDGGPFASGVWAVDPDTGETVEWAPLPSGEVTHTQYGTSAAVRGSKEAYVSFPDQGSGSAKTYIFGTGDGGRSWHVVSTIPTTGGVLAKIVGPDANGCVYMQPSPAIPTYGTGIMVGTLPSWT